MAGKNFTFICGPDDFLVGRAARARFDEACAEVTDEFSREVISGFANRVDEVGDALTRFRDAVQTVPLFGGKRLVWLKDINFLADTVTGRSETTLGEVESLQELLASVNPEEVTVILSAAPVDRRRAFLKWCEKNADFQLLAAEGDDALASVVAAEAKVQGVTLSPDAERLLLARIGSNSRLLVEEVRKLATFAGDAARIEEAHVAELTPNVAEGDFFETAEAFFKGDLTWTLTALRRHFFTGGDARPVLSALQNRNRILIQLRALIDGGSVRLGPRGVDKGALDRAAQEHGHHFGPALAEKSAYNIFTQNPWYLGKLAGSPDALPPLRRLIDNQQEFIRAFEALIERGSGEEEDVLRELAVRCLGGGAAAA